MRRRAGVLLYLTPKTNLTGRQYLVIFKAEDYQPPFNVARKFQVYHNFNLDGEQTLGPGDDQFAITADCMSMPSYIFFNLANISYPLFKEIQVNII